jgi:phage regulator Rha-like protein
MKIEEKTIVRQISAFKASLIKKLDELENSTMMEMHTASQVSICQMEREESWSHYWSKSQVVVNVSLSMQVTSLIQILLFPFDK